MLQIIPEVPYSLDRGTYAEVLIRSLEITGQRSPLIPNAPCSSLSQFGEHKKNPENTLDQPAVIMDSEIFKLCSLTEEGSLADQPISVSSLCSSSAAAEYHLSISSIVNLYHTTNLQELYGTAMKIVYGWLAWEGLGSPGSTTEPTSRLVELARRARRRGAVPTLKAISALEVAIDCRGELQRLQREEGKDRFEMAAGESDVLFM